MIASSGFKISDNFLSAYTIVFFLLPNLLEMMGCFTLSINDLYVYPQLHQ